MRRSKVRQSKGNRKSNTNSIRSRTQRRPCRVWIFSTAISTTDNRQSTVQKHVSLVLIHYIKLPICIFCCADSSDPVYCTFHTKFKASNDWPVILETEKPRIRELRSSGEKKQNMYANLLCNLPINFLHTYTFLQPIAYSPMVVRRFFFSNCKPRNRVDPIWLFPFDGTRIRKRTNQPAGMVSRSLASLATARVSFCTQRSNRIENCTNDDLPFSIQFGL